MNVHVYFSIEEAPDGAGGRLLSVVCQDSDGRIIPHGEFISDATVEALALVIHKKLAYRLRRWLDLPATKGKHEQENKT